MGDKPVFPMLRAMKQHKKSKFLQKNVLTIKELLNILHGKTWTKYKHLQAKSDTFEAT